MLSRKSWNTLAVVLLGCVAAIHAGATSPLIQATTPDETMGNEPELESVSPEARLSRILLQYSSEASSSHPTEGDRVIASPSHP